MWATPVKIRHVLAALISAAAVTGMVIWQNTTVLAASYMLLGLADSLAGVTLAPSSVFRRCSG
jgi:hypothetical protein